MSNHVTITGRLGDDIELRFSSSGKAVANGRVADTPRKFNQQSQQFEDAGETLWLGFSIWDTKAEALASTAHKGDLVTVTGTLVARSWDAQDGTKRTVTEIKASEVAVVPRVTAKPRTDPNPGGGDPWANQQPAQSGWGGSYNAEPAPF